ncbi:hypothetical protein FQR65_LT04491 [Abscondita terminalis]|nr:hypothetical protein FQR65_LT04491 [Abscondita terminalis]
MLNMETFQACEKLSIRDSAKSLKKYGSTSKHVNHNQNLIKHVVTSSDTLQGIALRYGVTMEQIRRLNRLWASDSLFLRESLLIPVTESTSFSNTAAPSLSHSLSEPEGNISPTSDDEVLNFLDKIDNSIASTKAEVKKFRVSEFATILDEDYSSNRNKFHGTRRKQLINNNTVTDQESLPQPLLLQQGYKLRSSLQRLQQEQDELFEL